MTVALTGGAFLVSLCALYLTRQGLREASKSNTVPAMVETLREYRSDEMRRDRGLLLNTEIDPCAFYELPDDVQQAAYHVSHFLDHMGVLLSNRLIDLDVLAANIGISAEAAWFKLEPCVRVERERRSTGIYLDYFEHLIASIRTIPIEERYRDLKRLELDPERPKAYL